MILYFESHLSKQQTVSETKVGSEKGYWRGCDLF